MLIVLRLSYSGYPPLSFPIWLPSSNHRSYSMSGFASLFIDREEIQHPPLLERHEEVDHIVPDPPAHLVIQSVIFRAGRSSASGPARSVTGIVSTQGFPFLTCCRI